MNEHMNDVMKAALEATNIASICMMHALEEDVKLPPRECIEQALAVYLAASFIDEHHPDILEDMTNTMLEDLFEGDEAD